MLTIKLRRAGRRHLPFYHLVVSEKRSKATGRFVDKLGWYNPLLKKDNLKIDNHKLSRWISQGATLSRGVTKLLKNYKWNQTSK